MPPSKVVVHEIVSDDDVYKSTPSADPPPSKAESVFAEFATSTEPFATAESPVPPSATAKSVIPVIDPPVIATLESSRCATRVATAYPVPPVLTVVVGSDCKFLNNFHF